MDDPAVSRHWNNWLPTLGATRLKVKEKVEEMFSMPNEIPLAFFTVHGPTHCVHVENNIHKLIPDDKYTILNEKERLLLISAAWLHDIGMLRSVARDQEIMHDEEIRSRHHDISKKYIVNSLSSDILGYDEKYIVGDISFYHRKKEDIEKLGCKEWCRGVECRVRLLAAYLRLADAIHIDHTRSPEREYFHSLGYIIPPEQKIHWIKSRLITSVHPNCETHTIEVYFRIPSDAQLEKYDVQGIKEKVNNIIKSVLDGLREELTSVKKILDEGGISRFDRVVSYENNTGVSEDVLKDILTLVQDLKEFAHPSASRMLELTLENIAGCAGYVLSTTGDAQDNGKMADEKAKNQIFTYCRNFLNSGLADRSCLVALNTEVAKIMELTTPLSEGQSFNMGKIIKYIGERYKSHFEAKYAIRTNARAFFSKTLQRYNTNDRTFNFLLFAYSELSIRVIIGFREALISLLGRDPNEERNTSFENYVSKRMRIFICEGNSKTQVASYGDLIYYDCLAYAKRLAEKYNFANLTIIPDIVVSNVIENNNIDFIVLGANGFTNEYFTHSAGHGTIIRIVDSYRNDQNYKLDTIPRIILATSLNRFTQEAICPQRNSEDNGTEIINGQRVWLGQGHTKTRNNRWNRISSELRDDSGKISFYNPMEDKMPVYHIDVIVTEEGYNIIRTLDEREKTEC